MYEFYIFNLTAGIPQAPKSIELLCDIFDRIGVVAKAYIDLRAKASTLIVIMRVSLLRISSDRL